MSRKSVALYVCIALLLLAGVGLGLHAIFSADGTAAGPARAGRSGTAIVSVTATTSGFAATATSGSATTANAGSYQSATAAIAVSKVTAGSGRDAVTYYMADLQLSAGAVLQSALAEGFQTGNVAYTSTIAEASNALLAINGDYWTARDTGVIIRDGVLYQDSPARAGLALYKDGTMKVYDETTTTAEQLLAEGVYNTFSFGPVLLDEGVEPDGLDTTEIEDIGQEHTILGTQPRTGVGIISQNHYVFVVVDGRATGYSRGVTLSEFAQIFRDLGCTTAYNLDGGGSSAMYFQGQLVNNPLGQGRERGISDILYVGSGA